MSREPLQLWCFVLAVVRFKNQYLLIQESKHNNTWYLPAGRVEPGENLITALKREAFEESGVEIVPEGVIRIEHTPYDDGTGRLRVVFAARPKGQATPKQTPDDESLRAAWVPMDKFDQYVLRSEEVKSYCEYIERGGTIYPLSILAEEPDPLR